MLKKTSDFVIIGGGVIGLTLAKALSAKFPDCSIRILEKETRVGVHTSGRNSGVLHAGFYYGSDTWKAKFCRIGCAEWRQFAEEYNTPIRNCGKIVAPTNTGDTQFLNDLYSQGLKNGVDLELIDRSEAIKY